jgi:hypothetical protein
MYVINSSASIDRSVSLRRVYCNTAEILPGIVMEDFPSLRDDIRWSDSVVQSGRRIRRAPYTRSFPLLNLS